MNVVAHEPGWAQDFARESLALQRVLRPWADGAVEHVGSTAVAGLSAKPVIDMIAPVRELATAAAAAGPLSRLGYGHRSHRIDGLLFVKPDADDVAAHRFHLHLATRASPLCNERLAFRDALRGDPQLVAQYAALKSQLLAERGGRLYSARDKDDFIRQVLLSVGIGLDDERHVR